MSYNSQTNTYSEIIKKFNSTVPKKQAKSYEIDLGQNVK